MLIGRLQVADRYQRQAGTTWEGGRQVLEAGRARRCGRWPELTSAANRLGSMRMMQRMQQALRKAVKAGIEEGS
jgi:hypothetical protein